MENLLARAQVSRAGRMSRLMEGQSAGREPAEAHEDVRRAETTAPERTPGRPPVILLSCFP